METTWQIFGQLQPAPNVSTQTVQKKLTDFNRWIEVYGGPDPEGKLDLVFCDDESECFATDLEKLLTPLCAWARLEIARTCDDRRFCAVLENGVFQEHEAVSITLYEGMEDEFVDQLPDGIVRKVLERRILSGNNRKSGQPVRELSETRQEHPDNARQISEADAVAQGYGKCSKCW